MLFYIIYTLHTAHKLGRQ